MVEKSFTKTNVSVESCTTKAAAIDSEVCQHWRYIFLELYFFIFMPKNKKD